jgi:predicted dithiol-disulfide oxidoreductase (DUF899 family)
VALPEVVSRDAWLTARKDLLQQEKELTRTRDALAVRRRMLPMVRVETPYVFTGPEGPVGFEALFDGREQLVVQHFMFDPSWDEGCPGCTAGVDELSAGILRHLNVRRTSFALVSRAPWPKLEAYRQTRGWDVPWYSAGGTTFNYDFQVTVDESVRPMDVNYLSRPEIEGRSNLLWMTETPQPFEVSGYSCFLRADGEIFHTYSVYGRGTEDLGGTYAFLDWTALGRQEEWQEPKDRVPDAFASVPFFQV